MAITFSPPSADKSTLEGEGAFTPRFDEKGLITAIVTDHASGELLMVAHVNAQALALTLETGHAHYYSRSRQSIWKKGETSGNLQVVKEILTDCDQDAIWMKVEMTGHAAACHTGRISCFYRSVTLDGQTATLTIKDNDLQFDPHDVYDHS